MVEDRILHRHHQRERPRLRARRVVGEAVRDADLQLNRRVAAEQRAVVEQDPIVEHAEAGAGHGLVAQRIAGTDARLEHVLVRFRESARQIVEQPLQIRVARRGNHSLRVRREAAAREHHAVVDVATDDEAASRIHPGRVCGVIESGIEHRRVVQQRVPWWPEHVADAAFDRQPVRRLPAVLQVGVHRERAPLGERALADLAVVGEQPHRRVRHGEAGPAGAAVGELEAAVLVVGVARLRADVDLIEVVLAGIFEDHAGLERVPRLQAQALDICQVPDQHIGAGLERMAPLQVAHAVGPGVDGTSRRRGIGTAVDVVEVGD